MPRGRFDGQHQDEADLADQIRRLAEKWMAEQAIYPDTPEANYAASAVRCCCREMLSLIWGEPDE